MDPMSTKPRTFVGDPAPPPDFSKAPGIPAATAAPVTEKSADTSSLSTVTSAPAPSKNIYRVAEGTNGEPRRLFLLAEDLSETELGVVSIPDADQVLNQSGAFNPNAKTWDVPEDVALSLLKGKQPFPKFLSQQFAAGDAAIIRGQWGAKALKGEVTFADAMSHGDIERQKMLQNERPDIAWSEAPFGRFVAETRYVAGATANLLPFMGGAVAANLKAQGIVAGVGVPVLAGAALMGPGTLAAAGGVAIAGGAALATLMETAGGAAVFKYTMDTEGGNMALDMMGKGFDESTVRSVAPVAGAIVGAAELVGFRFMTAPMKRAFAKNILKSAPVQKAMSNWLLNYTKELGGEVGVEVAQEKVSQIANNFAAFIEAKPELAMTKEQMNEALIQTAVQATAGMAVIKLPGAAMDFAASRPQKAAVRLVKAQIAAGEVDAKTITVAALEKVIAPELDATKLNAGLENGKAFEYGKKIASDENALAALHAKAEALQIKKDALMEGKETMDLSPEVQNELIPLTQQISAVNEIGRGVEEGLSAKKSVEPMVPVKEPRTPAEAVERRFSEQTAALKTLDKESKALDRELTDINDQITERMNEGKPTKALSEAANRIAAKIAENDAKGAEIVMTPMGQEEHLAQSMIESGAHVNIAASELIRLETDLVNKVAAAKESGRLHGEAFARREVGRVQAYIQELVKRADIPAEERAKFMSVLRNTKTIEQLEKNYPAIRDRIFVAEETRRAKIWDATLKKALKSGKAENVNGKPMGKFGDADTQAVVDTIARVTKMTRKDAEMELFSGKMDQDLLEASDEGSETYSPLAHALAVHRMEALRYRAGQMSTEAGARFVAETVDMMSGARSKFLERKLAEREARLAQEKKAATEVLGDITPPEGWERSKVESGSWAKGWHVPAALRGIKVKMFDSLASLSDLLAFRSGAKKGQSVIEKMLRTDEAATKEQGLVTAWAERANEAMDAAYGFVGKKWAIAKARRKMQIRLMEVHDLGTHKNAAGQNIHLKYSIDQAIKRYMERMDPTLADNFTGEKALAYTPEMEAEIFGLLKEGDKKYAMEQIKLYRELYKEANAVYRRTRGIDLPFNQWYSPIRVLGFAEKVGAEVSPDANAYQVSPRSTLGGWGISRVKHGHPLEQLSSILTMNEHIRQIAHYVAWEAKVRDWNSLMVNPEFKGAIVGLYGSETMDALRLMVQRITAGTHERAIMRGLDSFITKLMSAGVIGKPLMIAKQLTSMPAFASGVPFEHIHLFLAEMANSARQGFSKEWLNSDFVKSRGWNQFQELRAAHEMGKTTQPGVRKIAADVAEMMATPLKLGDRGAILIGGDALFRYLRKQGKSVDEALAETSRIARETQSSGSLSDLSVFQSQSGVFRLFTAYRNQPVQFLRFELSALRAMASKGFMKGEGRMSRMDAIKTLAIYHFIIPMLFQYVVDGFDWDEEHQKRAMIFGSFADLPILGQLLSNAYHILAEEEGAQFGGGDLMDSWTRDVTKALKAISEGEDVEDYVAATSLLADPMFKAMSGIPVKPIINTATGAKQAITGEGEMLDALKLVAGYSPFMIEEQSIRRGD